jgi:thymidylate kinase
VICDRYPLPGLLFTDGPALRGTRSPTGPVGRYLAGKEEEYYRRIPPPDVVVVLTVPPEIAVARRKEADPATVRARAQEVSDAGWRAGEIVVDAARPAKEVLLEVKARLWPLLR